MGKGKGRRRRQANYLAARDGQTTLPAPPSASDLAAVPFKLRRIISLKASSSQGHFGKCGNISESKTKIMQRGKGLVKKQNKVVLCGEQEDTSSQIKDAGEGHQSLTVLSSRMSVPVKKTKKEEDLQVFMAKYKATPRRKGLSEQKKRYLQEKKKKKKSTYLDLVESNLSLHVQDKIGFGDVVEAPPKLHFPKKQKNISDERLRQQAVEMYRQKKKWLSRPGSHQPPPLQNVNMSRG